MIHYLINKQIILLVHNDRRGWSFHLSPLPHLAIWIASPVDFPTLSATLRLLDCLVLHLAAITSSCGPMYAQGFFDVRESHFYGFIILIFVLAVLVETFRLCRQVYVYCISYFILYMLWYTSRCVIISCDLNMHVCICV